MKNIVLNKKTKSMNEWDKSTPEKVNMNKKSFSSYEVARGKPTQKKS